MPPRLAVVLSQGQSQNPVKRQLEEDLVTALIMEPGIDVAVIPNLYDLSPHGTGVLALQGITGDLVVVSWLFERAASWILDQHEVRGTAGQTALTAQDADDSEDADAPDAATAAGDQQRVAGDRPVPSRKIYCLDLKAHESAGPFVAEIKRIASEAATSVTELTDWVSGSPQPTAMQRYLRPTNNTALGTASAPSESNGNGASSARGTTRPQRIAEDEERRWYPVIDFSRCTNCLECIDFCLFGVYGIDAAETILVEQPDNCRKGCPACSRVCPENAIIFPQHKSPAIAGAPAEAGALKIDLSSLFGAPDAVEVAARERDEQLLLAGRETVGSTAEVSQKQSPTPPADKLDALIDQLDEFDL